MSRKLAQRCDILVDTSQNFESRYIRIVVTFSDKRNSNGVSILCSFQLGVYILAESTGALKAGRDIKTMLSIMSK